jgi:pilus assembly protein Flp/PilA
MLHLVGRLVTEEEGQGMTEYALVLGVIAIATIGLITLFSEQLITAWQNITTKLGGALSPTTTTTP